MENYSLFYIESGINWFDSLNYCKKVLKSELIELNDINNKNTINNIKNILNNDIAIDHIKTDDEISLLGVWIETQQPQLQQEQCNYLINLGNNINKIDCKTKQKAFICKNEENTKIIAKNVNGMCLCAF